jgi:MFS family permease
MTLSSARLAQVFSAIGHFYTHLFMACFGFVAIALEAEWGKSYDELLKLGILGSFLFGAASLPAGWLGDSWSARGTMAVFFVGLGASALWCGLSGGETSLWLGLAGIGLFAAIYHPVGIPWLVRHCHAQGKTLGLNGVFGNYGVGFAGLIMGGLIDLWGWRAAFIIPAIVTLLTAAVFVFLIATGRIGEGEPAAKRANPPSRIDMARGMIILLANILLSGIIFQAFQYALPKAFEEQQVMVVHGGFLGIGLSYFIVYVFAGTLQYIGGHLADRYPPRTLYIVTYMLQVPLLMLVAVLTGLPTILATMLAVTLAVGVFPAENVLFVHFTPERHRSLAFGFRYVVAFGAAPLALQLIAWTHGESNSVAPMFWLLAALAAIISLSAFFLPGERKAASLAAAE